MNSSVVFLPSNGFSRHRRYFRGGSQPRRAAHHGTSVDRGDYSRKTQTLQSSRHLPDDGASLELANDRSGDVAVIPATSEASVTQGIS